MLADKHPALIVWSEEPFNAEPPLDLLRQLLVTPTELFYVRNHGPVPEVDPSSYRLAVVGMLERPLELSLGELRERFASATVTALLACAGNRRAELTEIAAIPGQTPWGAGAIGNAAWTGVRLRDVLLAAGIAPAARHVAFSGLDQAEEEGQLLTFGGSIPLDKALSPEVVLAYEMNGEPLPDVHGFPLRVVVPGYIGARSVKWLSSVTVQSEPSSSYFQARAYRLLPPPSHQAAGPEGFALGELAVNAVVCRPLAGEAVSGRRVLAQGYALAGGARSVERVDLSLDRGESWLPASLADRGDPWSWRFWEAELQVRPGPCELVVRAFDSAANTQPEDAAKIWNPQGYVNNAWHRVSFTASG